MPPRKELGDRIIASILTGPGFDQPDRKMPRHGLILPRQSHAPTPLRWPGENTLRGN